MRVVLNQRAPVGAFFLNGAEGMPIHCALQTKKNEWQKVVFDVQPYLDSNDTLRLGARIDANSFSLDDHKALWCRITAQDSFTLRGETIEEFELRAEQSPGWSDGWRVTERPFHAEKLTGKKGQELRAAIVDFLLPYIKIHFDRLFKLARQRQVEYIKEAAERIRNDMQEMQDKLRQIGIKV